MTLLDFLLAGDNLPFTVALTMVGGLFLLEAASFLIGLGSIGDHLTPELGLDHDIHLDGLDTAHGEGLPAWAAMLSWLHVGRVPVTLLLVIFLLSFAFGGLVLQQTSQAVLGGFLNVWLASGIVLFPAIYLVRLLGGLVARVMPKDETTAVSRQQFVGHTVVLSQNQGVVTKGCSGEARLKDAHGQTHYLRVEPIEEQETFQPGESVLLVRLTGSVFQAVRHTTSTP